MTVSAVASGISCHAPGRSDDRLGHHHAVLVAQPLQARVLGMQLPDAPERQPTRTACATSALRRVADRPQALAVADADARLHRRARCRAARPSPRRGRSCARARRADRPRARRSARGRTAPRSRSSPAMSANSSGSTASISSRRIAWKPSIKPLWTNSQRPWRNGWQLVCCTAVPDRRAHVGEEQRRLDVRRRDRAGSRRPRPATTLR